MAFTHKNATKRVRERIVRHVRTSHQGIRPIPIQGLFNRRCHDNCMEYLRTHPHDGFGIAEVMCVDDGDPVLHYVVHAHHLGYLEVTLGWRTPQLEYYLIRILDPQDHQAIYTEFDRSLAYWREEYTSWFDRAILGVDRVV